MIINKRHIKEVTNGKIFSVTFQKKDGTMRKMRCRTGVTKHLNPHTSGLSQKHKDADEFHNQLRVWDLDKQGYRKINCDSITQIKCGESLYEIEHSY